MVRWIVREHVGLSFAAFAHPYAKIERSGSITKKGRATDIPRQIFETIFDQEKIPPSTQVEKHSSTPRFTHIVGQTFGISKCDSWDGA